MSKEGCKPTWEGKVDLFLQNVMQMLGLANAYSITVYVALQQKLRVLHSHESIAIVRFPNILWTTIMLSLTAKSSDIWFSKKCIIHYKQLDFD